MSPVRAATGFLAFVVVLTIAVAAGAQINPFARSSQNARLDRADLALLNAAADRLLAAKPPVDGASEAWNNPSTGAQGTVTMVRAYTGRVNGENYSCRRLQYEVVARGRQTPMTYFVNWCDILSQGWRIVS